MVDVKVCLEWHAKCPHQYIGGDGAYKGCLYNEENKASCLKRSV